MTDREIYEASLTKAVNNGYTNQWSLEARSYYADIFSHSFAKAYWGEEIAERTANYMVSDDPYCAAFSELPAYKWHLQQMVLEESPLKYLEKFL